MTALRVALILGLAFAVLSCSGNKEMDDLAQAQECLNNVPQSTPAKAEECLKYVEKYDSQQANILKCGIYTTAGGLVENRLVRAYDILKADTAASSEAVFMTTLALDMGTGDFNAGYTRAVLAHQYCKASGVPGLVYISGLILSGTYLAKVADGLGTIDLSDPTSVQNAVNNVLSTCGTAGTMDPDYGTCFGDAASMGAAVTTLSSAYCSSDEADNEVCQQLTSAVSAAGGDPADVGRALICFLEDPPRNYNPTTDQCF